MPYVSIHILCITDLDNNEFHFNNVNRNNFILLSWKYQLFSYVERLLSHSYVRSYHCFFTVLLLTSAYVLKLR